jgi:hypothetical protein
MNPLEFDEIPDEIKILMRAKRDLDIEMKNRQNRELDNQTK